MAQQVELTVKIGGNKFSPISYCSISQRIDWHHNFEILLPVDGFAEKNSTILKQAKDFIGQSIEIAFKPVLGEDSKMQNEFYGIITETSLSRRNRGNKEIHVRGFSPTVLMDGRPNCKSYSDMSLSDIASDLQKQIPKNDLKINIDSSFKGEIPFITQYKESNFHFLNRIADRYGEWCFYDGKELNFGRLDKSTKIDLPIDKNLTEFEFSLRIQNLNYNAVSYDYLENTIYSQNTKDFKVKDLDSYGDHALSQSQDKFKQINTYYASGSFKDESDFKDYFETRKNAGTKDLIFNEGASDNHTLNVGSIIEITGESAGEEDFGKFIIVSLNHSVDLTGKYTNRFTAIPSQTNIPLINRNVAQPESEIQPAVITENDDPEKLGRVRARFFWQEEKDSTPWIRTIHPHAGKTDSSEQHGFYFIPEIGDEVMVGFENNNPDKPCIIGNLYHGNSSPDHWHDPDNNIKSIRTKSGNQIILIDEQGKEEIRILNKDDGSPTNEISLSLNDNGKITIKSEGDLEISADNIKINANNDINVDAGQTTKFSSNDYKLDANNGIEITSQELELEGTNTSMTGNAQLKMEGKQTEISATIVSIEGSGQAELKGASVSVNGSATTEIKGGLVKIN